MLPGKDSVGGGGDMQPSHLRASYSRGNKVLSSQDFKSLRFFSTIKFKSQSLKIQVEVQSYTMANTVG